MRLAFPALARPRFRLRSALVLVAIVAVGLGSVLELRRRAERRARLPDLLIRAAESGDLTQCQNLLAEGAKVDSVTNGRYPWTPLMHAAWRGHTRVVQLLLDAGANPRQEDLDYFSAIQLAADEGHWPIVRMLVEAGADPTTKDGGSLSAIDYARQHNALDELAWLEARAKSPKPR